MFKRIIIYMAIAVLAFVGADKALTQETAIVPISLSIIGVPYSLTVTETEATWSTLPGTMAELDEYVEDLGPGGRNISVQAGDHAPLSLVWEFSEMTGPVAVPNGGNAMKCFFYGGNFAQNNEIGILPPNTPCPVIPLPNSASNVWHIIFTYFDGFVIGDYVQTLTFTLTPQ